MCNIKRLKLKSPRATRYHNTDCHCTTDDKACQVVCQVGGEDVNGVYQVASDDMDGICLVVGEGIDGICQVGGECMDGVCQVGDGM